MVYTKVLSREDKDQIIRLVQGVSVCWTNMNAAGDYDNDKANALVKDFCDYLVGAARTDKPKGVRPPHFYDRMIKQIELVKYQIKQAIEYERAIDGLEKRRWFSFKGLKKGELFKLNPWINYITIHSTLNYLSAINLYGKCTSLPWKLTRRRAKFLTKLIIEQANCGVTAQAIDVGTIAALIERGETKKGAKK